MARITRFQVMATLQAARARALGLGPDEAKSWGLNRALFYAAAKRGWENAHAVGAKRPVIPEFESSARDHDPQYSLGTEKAYVDRASRPKLRFKFSGKVQRPEDFDRQVIRRFDDWKAAWAEAVDIIKSADPSDLEKQSRFFEHVYKPRRDSLAERWSRLEAPATLSRRSRRAA